jgi:hypothetical protein
MKSFLAGTACAITLGLAGLLMTSAPVSAKNVCGWYAVVFCSPSEAKAITFVNGGWGALIKTKDYKGFKSGLYCVVSGPQPKSSALRDRKAAIAQGISASTYIKRACTDEKNIGD